MTTVLSTSEYAITTVDRDRRMSTELTLKSAEEAVALTGLNFDELEPGDESPMAKLTVKQRRWVVAFCALAGVHGALTRAAEYAGYAAGTHAVRGSQLYRRLDIQLAIKYLAETKAHVAAFAAMTVFEDILRTGTENGRLKAADRILGHAGMIIRTVSHHEITIDDNRSEDQVMAAVVEQMKELGLSATVINAATDPFKSPEDDDRTHASGNRPEGMNQGRLPYKRKLVPGKDRPAKIKKATPVVDLDWDDVSNEGDFDDV
jgi:phage terminase small subunit